MIMRKKMEKKIKKLQVRLEEKYKKLTPKSYKLYKKLQKKIPGGVNYPIRWFSPYPIYVDKAKETRITDIDGNTYIDYWMGHGSHMLGHAPKVITEIIKHEIEYGTHLGYSNKLLDDYTDTLLKAFRKMEMVKLTNSGTESNMYTVRAVRAYTKKKKIVKIKGGWHGGTDPLHTGVYPPYKGPESAGLLNIQTKYTISVPFNDIQALEKSLRNRDVAAVIIEPVLGAGGAISPKNGYLKAVRETTFQYDSLLVFDEVITGFRLLPGGAQEYYNVYPDITILGKIVGGGVPGAGAILGKEEIMECFNHLTHMGKERCFVGGTFTCNNLTLLAGQAMMQTLMKKRHEYDESSEKWKKFRANIEEKCREKKISCYATGERLIIGLHFTTKRPESSEDTFRLRWSNLINKTLHLFLRVNNILYLTEEQFHLLPSLLHREEEINYLESKIREFIDLISKDTI